MANKRTRDGIGRFGRGRHGDTTGLVKALDAAELLKAIEAIVSVCGPSALDDLIDRYDVSTTPQGLFELAYRLILIALEPPTQVPEQRVAHFNRIDFGSMRAADFQQYILRGASLVRSNTGGYDAFMRTPFTGFAFIRTS